jgi:hypothetical protein
MLVVYASNKARISFKEAPHGTSNVFNIPSNTVISDVLFGQLSEQEQFDFMLPQLVQLIS